MCAQIDLRLANSDQGSLEIVVAPIARFLDAPEGAKFKIEQIGSPDKIINGFHPEIYGKPMQEDDLIQTEVFQGNDGLTHYIWRGPCCCTADAWLILNSPWSWQAPGNAKHLTATADQCGSAPTDLPDIPLSFANAESHAPAHLCCRKVPQ